MNPSYKKGILHMKTTILRVLFLVLVLPFPLPASLGGDVRSVQQDQDKMKGTLQTTSGNSYTLHEIQTPTGLSVKEYVSPSGEVFAVTWKGPFPPDLRQILGAYFDQYSQAAQTQQAQQRGHGPLFIQQLGLVLQVTGHMKSFSGKAYVPQMLPAGVRAEDLQ
jgi:hypothetical protein